MFELIPAIDLKGGKCVRLQEGVAERATEYGDDPVAMALHWQEHGASRLHVVDLDGAFSGDGRHFGIIRSILQALRIPVQVGGGLRTVDHVLRILDLGADRAILGTAAVEHPEVVEETVRRRGASIVVGIDARDGLVAVRGWREGSGVAAAELALKMRRVGVERVIYTDIRRDGMLSGVNVEETARLARTAGIRVIASGGVAAYEDVRALWERRESGIEGVILGRALYERKVDFRDLRAQADQWGADAG